MHGDYTMAKNNGSLANISTSNITTRYSQQPYSQMGYVMSDVATFPSTNPFAGSIATSKNPASAESILDSLKHEAKSKELMDALVVLIESCWKNANGDAEKIQVAQTLLFDALMELIEKRGILTEGIKAYLDSLQLNEILKLIEEDEELKTYMRTLIERYALNMPPQWQLDKDKEFETYIKRLHNNTTWVETKIDDTTTTTRGESWPWTILRDKLFGSEK